MARTEGWQRHCVARCRPHPNVTKPYERLVRDPFVTMEALYRWLNLDPAGVDLTGLRDPENVTPNLVRIAHLEWDSSQAVAVTQPQAYQAVSAADAAKPPA